MKFLILVISLIPFYSYAFECSKHDGVDFGNSCSIRLGEEAKLNNGDKITYRKLLEDSRCPTGARCVWAGQVRVKLSVNDKDIELTLPGADNFSGKNQKYRLHKVKSGSLIFTF